MARRRKKVRLTGLSKSVLAWLTLGAIWVFMIRSERAQHVERQVAPEAQVSVASELEVPSTDEISALGAVASPDTVVVASWNLEWFGSPQKRNIPARTAESLVAVSQVIIDRRPGVVVLNEINVASAQWAWLAADLLKQGYQSLQPVVATTPQETVLIYDTQRVTPVGAVAFIPQVPISWGGCTGTPRSPVVGTFRVGNFDFTVAGVHLRAQGKGKCGDAFRDVVREAEINTLLDHLSAQQKLKMADPDVIVLGDLNVEPTHSTLKPLWRRGLRLLTQPGRMAPTTGRLSYRHGKYSGALDHILVSEAAEREYVQASAYYPPRFSKLSEAELEQYRRHLSDHALVSAQFRVDLEDDD